METSFEPAMSFVMRDQVINVCKQYERQHSYILQWLLYLEAVENGDTSGFIDAHVPR